MHTFFRLTFLALLALGLSSCATSKFGGSDSDSVTGTPLPDRQEGISFLADNVDRNKFAPIHFAYDSHSVSSSEQPKILEIAQFMKSASNTIIIAGFTDERGTPEYNRGLGERRALAVRTALIQAGGNPNRLQTVSFGSEMPADPSSTEAAWSKNRRAEFGVVR